ncbi:uncharacterized protein F5147DRAFT_658605 [Suillus discolor]|uniref:Uncharacterized protein n=1 Tax=Suillus discolor TaxID=1912936 RepID=A0A9P7EU30_9AGAM|nr:uncharacterized protein F5147DRAFT_658605 [Suillus discolor]KAG2088735.1 hypothetical protein F5147DRAFT_658605 [Suillus discolor]
MSQAHTTSARPAQPYGGPDNDHDGCSVIFPQMLPETLLCQLCKKLKKQGLTDDKETLKQCFQCGICGTHIGDLCGLCKHRAHEENGTSDPEAVALQARRCNIIKGCLHQPLGPSTPELELNNLRENNGKPGSITIYVECRLSQKPSSVNCTLGTYCASYAETMTFWSHILNNPCSPALHENVIKLVNPKWTSKHISDLLVMKNTLVKIILGVVTRENQCQAARLEKNVSVDMVLLLKANHQLLSGRESLPQTKSHSNEQFA